MTTLWNKLLFLLLMMSALIIAFSTVVFASTGGIVTVDNLNVRSEPTTASAVITRFNTGQAVEISGMEDGFFVIEINGNLAYISADFVKVLRTYATISGNAVNVRSGPDIGSAVLDQFYSGQRVAAVARTDGWIRIEHKGSTAYVSQDFVSGDFLYSLRAASPASEPSVIQHERSAPESAAPLIPREAGDTDYLHAVISSSAGLRLRREPNTYSDIITLIPSGTTVSVLYRLSDWAKVSFNGHEGYISKEFVNLHHGPVPLNPNSLAARIIAHGKQFLGTPYLWAGNDLRAGVDCSGFVHHVFRDFGIILHRNSVAMTGNGVPVERDALLPGDLVFFDTGGNGRVSHIGIYIGGGDFIHSSSSRRTWGVVISSLYEPYYIRTYVTARRVL